MKDLGHVVAFISIFLLIMTVIWTSDLERQREIRQASEKGVMLKLAHALNNLGEFRQAFDCLTAVFVTGIKPRTFLEWEAQKEKRSLAKQKLTMAVNKAENKQKLIKVLLLAAGSGQVR